MAGCLRGASFLRRWGNGEPMTKRPTTRDVTFGLWMESLDATTIAGTESFHSQRHREAMTSHAAQKKLFTETVAWGAWAARDRDRAELAARQTRRKENFSTTQYQIALQAEKRK